MSKKTPINAPRRITADIQIDNTNTVAIRWDGGLSKDADLRTIQVYLNIALRFAHDLGGCDNAFEAMKSMVQETRAALNKTRGTPIGEKSFSISEMP